MESSIKERLDGLKQLQSLDSALDEIRNLLGTLPEEARELEDTIEGLETRKEKLAEEILHFGSEIAQNKTKEKDAEAKIKRYEEQQLNVRNTREYEAIDKEIEYQKLEIEHLGKKNKKLYSSIEEIEVDQKELEARFLEQQGQLEERKKELDVLENESKQDAERLKKQRISASKKIEERLLYSYDRIRTRVRNGLAVVSIRRGACGGCFNLVPPQQQADMREQRKLMVCEHCGRIFCDIVDEPVQEEKKKRTTRKKKSTT